MIQDPTGQSQELGVKDQLLKFQLDQTVNELGKSILLKLRISEKRHSRPTTKALAQRPPDASKIRKLTSNIIVS